jgi:hypothetical protein
MIVLRRSLNPAPVIFAGELCNGDHPGSAMRAIQRVGGPLPGR